MVLVIVFGNENVYVECLLGDMFVNDMVYIMKFLIVNGNFIFFKMKFFKVRGKKLFIIKKKIN